MGGHLDELLGVGHGGCQDAVGHGGGGAQTAGGLLLARAGLLEGLDGGGLEAASSSPTGSLMVVDAGDGDPDRG